jgi:hypothetical protein
VAADSGRAEREPDMGITSTATNGGLLRQRRLRTRMTEAALAARAGVGVRGIQSLEGERIGLGGVGKTRLTLVMASDAAASFGDGFTLLELTGRVRSTPSRPFVAVLRRWPLPKRQQQTERCHWAKSSPRR